MCKCVYHSDFLPQKQFSKRFFNSSKEQVYPFHIKLQDLAKTKVVKYNTKCASGIILEENLAT